MGAIPSIIENPYEWAPALLFFEHVLTPAFATPMHLWILAFIKKSMLKTHGGVRGKKSSATVAPSTKISEIKTNQITQSVVTTGQTNGTSAVNTSAAWEADDTADETRGVAKP
jgi:hypothetical protein